MWSLSRAWASVALIVLAIASGAAAEPSAADKEQAKKSYVEGMAHRDAGRHEGALAAFSNAFRLLPTPITALAVGEAYEAVGKLIEARDAYNAASAMPPKPKESEEAKSARESARNRSEAVTKRIPTMLVRIEDPPAGAELVIELDGASAISESAIAVNPGKHRVVARAGKLERSKPVTLLAGERKTVTLSFADEPSKTSDDGSPAPAPSPDAQTRTNPLVYVGFGAAGVFTITGLLGWQMASSANSEITADCTTVECDDARSRKSRGLVLTNVSIGLAAVGIGVGVVGLLAPIQVTPTTTFHTQLRVGVGWVGLEGRF
jgi:tetratricopeptide (TPR) repeat protein